MKFENQIRRKEMKNRKFGVSGILMILVILIATIFISVGCSGGGSNPAGVQPATNATATHAPTAAVWTQVYPKKVVYQPRPIRIENCVADMAYNMLSFIDFFCRKNFTLNIVYAGASEYFHSVCSKGLNGIAAGNNGKIKVSHNNAVDWTESNSGTTQTIWIVKATGQGFIHAGGDTSPTAGWSTTGDSWQQSTLIGPPPAMHFQCASVDPTDPNKVFYGGMGSHGISADNGATIDCSTWGTSFYAACAWGNGWIFYVDGTTSKLWVYGNYDLVNCKHTLYLPGISHGACKRDNNLYLAGSATGGGRVWKLTILDIDNWSIIPEDLTSKIPGYASDMQFWALSTDNLGLITLTASGGKIFQLDANDNFELQPAEATTATDVTGVDTSDPNAVPLAATGEDGTILKKNP